MKHGGSVSITARQQAYCASNFDQGGGEVPSPSVLRKAVIERFNCKELLWKCWRDPRDDPCSRRTSSQKSYHVLKEIDTIPDASFVSSV